MSALRLGANTQMFIANASGAPGDGVDITGIAAGTAAISSSRSYTTRDIPGGRGILAGQVKDDSTITFTVATDSNAAHDPVFRDAMGQRKYITYRKLKGSGNPQQYFEAVTMPTLTIDPSNDSCTWSVAITVDRAPQTTDQP